MHASRIPANCYCFQGMIITTGVERRESLGRSRAVMQRRRARACRVLNLNLNLNGTAGDNLVYGCRYPSRALLFLSCRRCAVASIGAWWCSVGDPGPRGAAACAPARRAIPRMFWDVAATRLSRPRCGRQSVARRRFTETFKGAASCGEIPRLFFSKVCVCLSRLRQ